MKKEVVKKELVLFRVEIKVLVVAEQIIVQPLWEVALVVPAME